MKLRKSRAPRKGYIQIIPMIDVMFFLLATFMLASLSMQNLDSLQVNLPEGQAEKLSAEKPITLTLTKNNEIFINKEPVTLDTLATTLKPLLHDAKQKLIISADNEASQGIVVQAMLRARNAGVQHFLIAVRHK
ncbi:MAG TPA: biopolymer transporter ExbD [Nitrosomonas nitrosa]|jgi:biopolymer transport protein ExbD|uniref:Biopolymer transport protein ExbD n=1 Tax=Nitrosomonas nitrosa TaxID=52442 RepID=A0A1I4U517_9PROT|nr:biopolymer transporter ExbD [Nitrosomonas nitrosa]MCO6433284.1 biopolymer transporter ExbD [Nitrosomonas nitrosa]PTQ90557.1 outer membrane transport energization protein ExbD [Nitrosomonas nitrosa]CAE6517285.1 Biopolymer transport protein ExbD [Nitrosomonas nitrosa]SFM84082.1 outer membrane transport energization protein ExbD [Nitrosomonas nitrosa]HBZ30303.1 biopolymer transporter ExbD [Nitrosomonas nitrosa]